MVGGKKKKKKKKKKAKKKGSMIDTTVNESVLNVIEEVEEIKQDNKPPLIKRPSQAPEVPELMQGKTVDTR